MAHNRELTERRNKAIHERYKELYEVERLRYDDVLKKLSDEFYLKEKSIFLILTRNTTNTAKKAS